MKHSSKEAPAVNENERLLDQLVALAQAFGVAPDLLTIFRALRDFAVASVPCIGIFIALYDPLREVRTATYGWGDGAELDVSQLPPMPISFDGPNSRAIKTGEVIITNDYLNATKGHPSIVVGEDNGLRPRSSLSAPMAAMGKIVGTIEVQSYELAAYRDEHVTALRVAANLAASAIENSRLIERESQARVAAEEALRLKQQFLQRSQENEDRYRSLVVVTSQIVWTTDAEGHVIDIPDWRALTGQSREEIAGWGWLDAIHPDDRERTAQVWALAVETRCLYKTEYRLRQRDGRYRYFAARGVPVLTDDGQLREWVGTCTDITESKQVEEAQRFIVEASELLAASLEYETTLQSVVRLCVPYLADLCLAYVVDNEGSIRPVAVAHEDPDLVEQLWERERQRAAKLNDLSGVPTVIRNGRAEFYADFHEATLDGGARVQPPSGERRGELRSAMVVPLLARGGHTLGALSFCLTRAERQYGQFDLAQAEDLAHRAALAVDNARLYQQAQEANRLKDEFLATLSHELRTPLTAILGWTGLLRTIELDETTASNALETIERNAQAQRQLIDDLLDASRIITGKLRLNMGLSPLVQVIETAIETVRPVAEAKAIQLYISLDQSVGAVAGDPDRLQQVFWNLLSNAVRFTPRGGRVEVLLERTGTQARIRVIDTGEGISPEFLPYVFDRFRQADGSTTRIHGGLGLGLAIVRHLVELHGGTVQVESAGAGQGATFTINLPLLIPHLRAAASDGTAHDGALTLDERRQSGSLSLLTGLHVLIVEDDADTRFLFGEALERSGARVTTRESAAAALTAMQSASYDLLISDIGLPNEDGYALIKKIRAHEAEQGTRLPAIALTAYAMEEDRKRTLAAGFQLHLAKPVAASELIEAVASLVGRAARA